MITPPWFWFLAGVALCLLEFFINRKIAPAYRLIALTMGVSAWIVWLILWRASITLGFIWAYIMYDGMSLQVLYWMGLSMALIIWIRPIFMPRQKGVMPSSAEAMTLTEILPGQRGRVLYEGSSWPATCEQAHDPIAANQKVYVLRREGNTLIVVPETLFQAFIHYL